MKLNFKINEKEIERLKREWYVEDELTADEVKDLWNTSIDDYPKDFSMYFGYIYGNELWSKFEEVYKQYFQNFSKKYNNKYKEELDYIIPFIQDYVETAAANNFELDFGEICGDNHIFETSKKLVNETDLLKCFKLCNDLEFVKGLYSINLNLLKKYDLKPIINKPKIIRELTETYLDNNDKFNFVNDLLSITKKYAKLKSIDKNQIIKVDEDIKDVYDRTIKSSSFIKLEELNENLLRFNDKDNKLFEKLFQSNYRFIKTDPYWILIETKLKEVIFISPGLVYNLTLNKLYLDLFNQFNVYNKSEIISPVRDEYTELLKYISYVKNVKNEINVNDDKDIRRMKRLRVLLDGYAEAIARAELLIQFKENKLYIRGKYNFKIISALGVYDGNSNKIQYKRDYKNTSINNLLNSLKDNLKDVLYNSNQYMIIMYILSNAFILTNTVEDNKGNKY